MKKAIKIIGLCCVAIIIIIGIYMAIPSKTLDFRGTVTQIETINNTKVIYLTLSQTPLSSIKTAYIVVADAKTKVSYCCEDDPTITLTDIKIGDTIDGNYRWLSKDNVAKFITVEYHN